MRNVTSCARGRAVGSIGAARLNGCAAIANKRLKRNRAGQVMPRAKSAHRDGTTHIVMSLPQLMLGLAVQKRVIAVARDSTALLLPRVALSLERHRAPRVVRAALQWGGRWRTLTS
jgi:hypothetical protein